MLDTERQVLCVLTEIWKLKRVYLLLLSKVEDSGVEGTWEGCGVERGREKIVNGFRRVAGQD